MAILLNLKKNKSRRKWTLLRILPLTLIDLVSQFTGHTIRLTFCTACVWKHGGTHSIVIVSDYLQNGKYAAIVFLTNHSAASRFKCPPLSGGCHIQMEEMVCMTSLPPVIEKVLWMVLKGQ